MTLVSAEAVREHVLKLRAAGGTYASIGQAATTGAMTVHCIANARRPKVQAEVASRLLAVSEADIRSLRPSPGGIMWRLRALIAMGHTCSRMAAATGIPAATLRRLVRGQAHIISPEQRQTVLALFDAWWDKTPPQRTRQEKLAVGNALKRAALNNWPTPSGLDEDELDQPGYQSQDGWRHACGTGIADDYPLSPRKVGRHEGPDTRWWWAVTAPEERLAKLADLLNECPPPDLTGGHDQCAHGTWPCAITQATWLAQGRDRDQEVQAACQAAARKGELEQADWEACQELQAAEREGRPCWDAEAEPGAG
jgi:hypothetical protein